MNYAHPPASAVHNGAHGTAGPVAVPQIASSHSPPQQAPPTRGTTAVVFAPRGGTGATTFAVNLACAATPVRHSGAGSVSLLDFALPLGNLAQHAQCSPPRSLADIGDRLDDASLASVVVRSDDGLRVLGCPTDPLVAEAITPAACVAALDWCARTSRLTIVDAGSALTEAAIAAIEAADVVFLHLTGDRHVMTSAAAIRHMLDVLGVDPRALRLVLNHVGAPGHLSPAEVADALGIAVDVVLAASPDIAVAAHRGQVLGRAWSDHPYARTVALLADSLQPAPPPAHASAAMAPPPTGRPFDTRSSTPPPFTMPQTIGIAAPPAMAPPAMAPPGMAPPGMPLPPAPFVPPQSDHEERRRFRWRRRRPDDDHHGPLGQHAVG